MSDSAWTPDILGRGFEQKTVAQPDDYSGPVVCTVVRKLCPCATDKAIVYVHGYSDYFFQADMAERFVEAGYNFYAVDLRKYGRSLRPGQKMFQVRDLREYFDDIDSAVDAAIADNNRGLVLLGHSTGGLTSSLYMALRPRPEIKALVLNSPFLDWNLGWLTRKLAIPAVSALARLLPDMKVRQKADMRYAMSMSDRHKGRWHYDSRWKPDILPDPDAAWVRAIQRGQRLLGRHNINVPVLLMHSDRSVGHKDAFDVFFHRDAILNVDLIRRRGLHLGPHVDNVVIEGAVHDIALSEPEVRNRYFDTVTGWLDRFPDTAATPCSKRV